MYTDDVYRDSFPWDSDVITLFLSGTKAIKFLLLNKLDILTPVPFSFPTNGPFSKYFFTLLFLMIANPSSVFITILYDLVQIECE